MNTTFRHGLRAAACLPLALAAQLALGQTALEQQVFRAPMPHTQAGGGQMVKAHYVRLETTIKASKMAEHELKAFQEGLRACLAEKAATGGKANPPKKLPAFDLGAHTDTYYAPNRQITYRRYYNAALNPADCSLQEGEAYEALLESSIGSCKIDLITGEKEGQCDMAAHARAPIKPMPAQAGGSLDAQMAQMAADPRTAAAAAQMRKIMGGKMPGGAAPAGQKKTILGIECEVVPGVGQASSVCRTQGGAFKLAAFAGGNGGMVLENSLDGFSSSKAVEAKLDTEVSAAVFAPQASGKHAGGAK